MKQKKFFSGLGLVWGPIALHFLINIAAVWIGEVLVMIGYVLKNMPVTSNPEAIELFMNENMTEMLQTALSRTVELTAFAALATMGLTVTLYILDVKKAKKALWVSDVAKPSLLHYGLLAVISVALCVFLNNLINMADLAFYSDAYQKTSEAFYSAGFGVQLVCLGIIVPVSEEFLYRGIVYRRYRLLGGMKPALIWSTLLFSAMHGNLVQMIYAAVLGLFLGYVFEKFGTIIAPICMHIILNLTSLILTKIDGFTWMFSSFERLAISTIGCSFIVACIFVMFQKMENRFPLSIIEMKKAEENKTPDMM